MTFAVMLFLMLGAGQQIDRRVLSTATVAPLFISRGVDAIPAFFVECRNTTNGPISSGSSTWPHTESAVRVDGSILPEPPGGRIGQGLTMDIQPDSIWRGIIELRQQPSGQSWAVALGAHTRMFFYVPLGPGRHTIAVNCAGVWSDELSFYWER